MVDTKCAKRIPVVVMNTNSAPRGGHLAEGAIAAPAKLLLSVEYGAVSYTHLTLPTKRIV